MENESEIISTHSTNDVDSTTNMTMLANNDKYFKLFD